MYIVLDNIFMNIKAIGTTYLFEKSYFTVNGIFLDFFLQFCKIKI